MVAGNGQPTALDEAVPAPIDSVLSPQSSVLPLPPLPDADYPILDAYIRHDADLYKIAQATGRTIHDVLQALSTAPLRDYVAQAGALADEADRRLAAATLRETIRTTDSPIEKRRAASALGRIVHLTRSAAASDRRSAATDRRSAVAERAALLRTLRSLNPRPRSHDSSQARHVEDSPRRAEIEDSEPPPDSELSTQHAALPPEPLRGGGHLTPGESVAAFLINLRDPHHHAHPMARVEFNTSMFVRMYALDYQQFERELAAALPLLERGPWRTEPAAIDGDAATVRVIVTHDDGSESACIFRLVKAQKHYPPDHWFVDGISPDSS